MKSSEAAKETASPPLTDRAAEKRVIEALIFVSDTPVTIEQIAQVLTGRSHADLRELIEDLGRDLAETGRALRVEEVAGGFRFSTRTELAPWVRLHFRNRNRTRLSAAGIETLAVIAYKQPVTAPEIQEIRGVDSQGPIRTLLDKKLVRTAGRKKVVGRPFLYGTSKEFLMHFGLASIEDLPPIEDFERLAGEFIPPETELPGASEAGAVRECGTVPGPEGPTDLLDAEGAGDVEDGFLRAGDGTDGAVRTDEEE